MYTSSPSSFVTNSRLYNNTNHDNVQNKDDDEGKSHPQCNSQCNVCVVNSRRNCIQCQADHHKNRATAHLNLSNENK